MGLDLPGYREREYSTAIFFTLRSLARRQRRNDADKLNPQARQGSLSKSAERRSLFLLGVARVARWPLAWKLGMVGSGG